MKLNEIQNGEITFENITLNPLVHFPEISIDLRQVSYFENHELSRDSGEEAICELENIYLSFDLMDLLSGNINVSKITLEEGHFRIITYPDSSVNFLNAVGITKDSKTVEEKAIGKQDTTHKQDELEKFLSIDYLRIKNVIIESDNRVFERNTSTDIEYLTVSFNHMVNTNILALTGDINLNFYQLKGEKILEDVSLHLATDLIYDAKEELVKIEPSHIVFQGARFDISGYLDLSDDGEMDLQVKLADKDFNLLSLVLREDVIHENRINLLKGDYYISGTIKGKTFDEIPLIELSFGIKEVNINLPNIGESIEDLNFSGYLTTGNKKDLSEAYFKLDHFSAKLPEGHTSGTLLVKNIREPYISLKWFLRTNISGFDDVFKIDLLDSLNGIITLDTEMEGEIDLQKRRIVGDKSKANLKFDNVSIRFPNVISLDRINGVIMREAKDLRLNELHLLSGNTDVTIDGTLHNILYLPLNIESDISADLSIVSDKFVFPEVFAFDSGTAGSFNHTINKLNLKFGANSNTGKLLEFESFPAIEFDIESFEASFNDFPDVIIRNSKVNFYDDTTGFNINFNPLHVFAAKGELILEGAYNGSEWKPYSLSSHAMVKEIQMLELLNQFEMELDSTSFFNSTVSGEFGFKLEFPKDSILFKTINLTDADLLVVNLDKNDTIISKSLTIHLNDVYYNLDKNANPLATLTTSGIIELAGFKSSQFGIENIVVAVSVKNGRYEIVPRSENLFKVKGQGVLAMKPWGEVSSYHLKYKVDKFAIEDWLASFLEKPILSGNMSLDIDVQMVGNNWDNLIGELNGRINSEGNNLLLYGLDIDNLLKKIERTQKFTLLDVGAVLFTGPVGLAVTKSSDMAFLIAGNPGEVSHIPKLVSNWDINDGILIMNDVAFATRKNRIAGKGSINLFEKGLDITIAVLNQDGSIKLSQNIRGTLDKPKLGEIKVLGTILAPVTNLFNSVFGIQGEIFYDGAVEHPQ